ncbi:terpene synthase family protein [Micromonospora maris]|uniref:Terpene synthase n=1 Tax=Micromonospora maris TaxID=1003110 RepID=A0A9X0I2H6_9ACTN|nr:terpene synthase [Micromonospora maris]AEB46404.1 terpene synthase metal-binding domain-containing protein [Micromonospora maris AB-18-032]KUJ45636.1 terpene synthase [Micromonospora maris]
MRTLALSVLHEPPFTTTQHGDTEVVARESAAWAQELGLISNGQRLHRADAAGLASRACPQAPRDRLRLLSDLITWLFVMDDACDEDGLGNDPTRLSPTAAALLDVLDLHGGPGTVPAAGPLGLALADLCRRVRAYGRPAVMLRFTAAMREYLLALLWEAANREHDRVPPVHEYVQMRRHTGGVFPSLALTDLALDGLPPAERRADPQWAALELIAANLICWCNDVFSYRKEHRTGPDAHNLVTVLSRETGDERAAMRAAAARFNHELGTYLSTESNLLAQHGDAVRPALTTRRNWIRATYDWSLAAERYA